MIQQQGKQCGDGMVLWFTGLSGSGKTTTASRLAADLKQEGFKVELLDGDAMRNTICKGLGFNREERMENIRRIVYVCDLLYRHGVIVIVSAITPYREMREYARSKIQNFAEIYVDCPLEECEKRDVKGLYARARRNEITHFTGISDPYEHPESPDITINTTKATVEENSRRIKMWLKANSCGMVGEEII
jgi:adenylylsulfate kinase